jgi:cytochrome b pre-mRNA-processing protein 3
MMVRNRTIRRLFGGAPDPAVAAAYAAAVAQARLPAFYTAYGVPDTLDGRFEMITVHVFLILHRLRNADETEPFRQALFDLLFADMDRGLREIGVGDLSVGREVKRMATGFYGRAAAYQAGLAGEALLETGLLRNLYGTVEAPAAEQVAAMATYLREQAAALADTPLPAITAGEIRFGAPQVMTAADA